MSAGASSPGLSVVSSALGLSVASGSLFDWSASSLLCSGTCGIAGGGDAALVSWTVDDEDSRCKRDRDRDCERSECVSGRGVISDASSKLSYTAAIVLAKCAYINNVLLSRRSRAQAHNTMYIPPLCRNCASSSASRARSCPPWLQGPEWCGGLAIEGCQGP